ncbi:site-specific integrase [Desulfovibrio sp. UIB00]|uniref:tyrosine-type recombinase/integrase n=1 Tax=Desulfovibrio sp. UIB00 TaxID=2804314 RepID=UPI001F0FF297|nr:site-specific integrase [Desulfovibrio sp. UIB00]MCH5145991.1 site-specific integrase [Desulfovibrio sp. UIB00]
MARIVVNGKQIASRMFPPGKKGGPEWRAAKEWEEDETLRAREQQERQTPTGCELLLEWGERYLAHVERSMSKQTLVEKKTVMRAFFQFCASNGVDKLTLLSAAKAYALLAQVADERGPLRANVYRKNLLAAWNWGKVYVEGFPQSVSPFEIVQPFQATHTERYVPPEEDVVKVLESASGQDLVMLLTFFFTGARRNEVFRLSWSKDVNLEEGRIRLTDHKGKNGQERVRWCDIHPELRKALEWWRETRPCKADNVFMQVHCDSMLGEPFRQRSKLMGTLCKRAGVKPFGFHAIRHCSAAVTFKAMGLNGAQIFLGHSRATTTDRYVRSAGLYGSQDGILAALGQSLIGSAAENLLEKVMPHEGQAREAFCNQGIVTNAIQ